MAGPPESAGPEGLDAHVKRLGARPAGGPWLLDALEQSGLLGRGGAAFPAWRKWRAVAEASRGNAVVVVNASEGEPLSMKDRTLVTSRPHVVLDGALLAGETLRATDVVMYLSRGSDQTERALKEALRERARAGARRPEVKIVRTSHRYVAGESSAVVNRLSGGPSKPKFTLARTAEKGIDDRPTLIQNAETIAHVAMIARYGPDWFRKLGTQASPGSTLLTLCGNVRRPGVYETDLSANLGGVIMAAGGPTSPPGGALLGGYFGSWVSPQALATLPLDRELLRTQHGASLGCGVVAVLPQKGCAIVEATRILTYLAWESAGQCGPCVNGLAALSEAMERIATSKPREGDLEHVHRWIDMVRGRGACHHPDGAVGQLASALTLFRDHLQVHLSGRRCEGLDARGFPRPPAVGVGWR
jgi:NADH:ubiquinone oxidoreductase subunit F (NADH-binding)